LIDARRTCRETLMTIRVARSAPLLILRGAESGDGVEMWRLARHRADQASPWFFVTLIRHMGESCWMAEKGGAVVGFIVAAPRRDGKTIHVFDLAFCPRLPAEDQYQLLEELLKKPGYGDATEFTFAKCCQVTVERLCVPPEAPRLPLAKCRRRREAPASGRRPSSRVTLVRPPARRSALGR
jgi:hypothetical protein